MIYFTKGLFGNLQPELTEEGKKLTKQRLAVIYQAAPIHYETSQDFEGSKQQLITLLTHIHQLNPETLGLFAEYRDNVAKLELTSGQNNINVTLKSTKVSLENALLDIEANHPTVERSSLNHLTVSLCYSGASSNIESAIGLFRPRTLPFLISTTKRTLVMSLAAEYLIRVPDRFYGNHIHDVNSLYNTVASRYGVPQENDHLATQFDQQIYREFWTYLKNEFSISAFLSSFMQLLSLPPEAVIDNQENNEKLKEFFLSLGMTDISAEDYLQLYDEVEEEDGFNVSLHPKNNFSLLLSCVVVRHLERKGYLHGAYFTINEQPVFHNGTNIVGVNAKGIFQVLDDQQIVKILLLLHIDEKKNFATLLSQISCEGLLSTLRNDSLNASVRLIFLMMLLQKPQLTPEMAKEASDYYLTNHELLNSLRQRVKKLFSTNSQLSLVALRVLIHLMPKPDQETILRDAIISGKSSHFDAAISNKDILNDILNDPGFFGLIKSHGRMDMFAKLVLEETGIVAPDMVNNPALAVFNHYDFNAADNVGVAIAIMAAKAGWLEVLVQLQARGVNLNVKDWAGLSLLDLAVKNNHLETAVKLIELKVELTQSCFILLAELIKPNPNNRALLNKVHDLGVTSINIGGKTAARYAIEYGNLELIRTLHELNVDLNQKVNTLGYSLVHLAADKNDKALLQRLNELKVDFNATDNFGRTALFLAVSRHKKKAFLELVRLGAQVNMKDKQGDTLAHLVGRERVKVDFKLKWLELLLEHGAHCEERNNKGKTPSDLIIFRGTKKKFDKKIAEYAQKRAERAVVWVEEPSLGIKRKANPAANGFFSKRPRLEKVSPPEWLPPSP